VKSVRSKVKNKSQQRSGGRKHDSRNLSAHREDRKLRAFDALSLFRNGKAKSLSAAARAAGTTTRSMWELVPSALSRDKQTGRFRVKATDRYSQKVEIVTDAGALVVTGRGSRQRQLAGQHRAAYLGIAGKKRPASALGEFRGKKVGGHELLSDYERLRTLANAGLLGQLDTLYVSAGGGR
jgi:hypothetical protein